MSKPASQSKLSVLHRKFAEYLDQLLDTAMEAPEDSGGYKLPLDAATMGCIRTFLKDNEITCEPEDRDDLAALREKYSRNSRQSVAEMSVQEILNAAGQSDYVN